MTPVKSLWFLQHETKPHTVERIVHTRTDQIRGGAERSFNPWKVFDHVDECSDRRMCIFSCKRFSQMRKDRRLGSLTNRDSSMGDNTVCNVQSFGNLGFPVCLSSQI